MHAVMRGGERMNHNIPQLRRRVYDLALDFHRAYSDAFVAVIQQWRLEETNALIDEVEDIGVLYEKAMSEIVPLLSKQKSKHRIDIARIVGLKDLYGRELDLLKQVCLARKGSHSPETERLHQAA